MRTISYLTSMTCHPELSQKLASLLPNARAELIALPNHSAGAKPDPISLFLLNRDYPQHELTQEQMLAVMNYPAYWAFCWASGQVMANFLIDNSHWVKGKTVLDFGCGSGVVAIAASKAGAARVVACDIDSDALLATRANAEANDVAIALHDDFNTLQEAFDLIVVADVLYDRSNLPWLDTFIHRADDILIADSRIKNFSHPGYQRIALIEATTLPDLDEMDEFRQVSIYHGRAKPSKCNKHSLVIRDHSG